MNKEQLEDHVGTESDFETSNNNGVGPQVSPQGEASDNDHSNPQSPRVNPKSPLVEPQDDSAHTLPGNGSERAGDHRSPKQSTIEQGQANVHPSGGHKTSFASKDAHTNNESNENGATQMKVRRTSSPAIAKPANNDTMKSKGAPSPNNNAINRKQARGTNEKSYVSKNYTEFTQRSPQNEFESDLPSLRNTLHLPGGGVHALSRTTPMHSTQRAEPSRSWNDEWYEERHGLSQPIPSASWGGAHTTNHSSGRRRHPSSSGEEGDSPSPKKQCKKKKRKEINDGYSSTDSEGGVLSESQFDFEREQNNKWFMKDHQRNYCTKRFREHQAEAAVRQITTTNPAPHHGCFRQIEVDSDIDDGLDPTKDKRVYGVRRQDGNYNIIYSKLMRTMGPLCRLWDLMEDVRTARVPMEVNIHRILTLIEQTITLMGQVANTITYQRRLNYLRLFVDDHDSAKEKLQKHQNKLSKRGKLFGKDFSKKILGMYDKSESLIQLWEQNHNKYRKTQSRGRGRGGHHSNNPNTNANQKEANTSYKRGRGGRGGRGRGRGRGRGNYANQGERLVWPLVINDTKQDYSCVKWSDNLNSNEMEEKHVKIMRYNENIAPIRSPPDNGGNIKYHPNTCVVQQAVEIVSDSNWNKDRLCLPNSLPLNSLFRESLPDYILETKHMANMCSVLCNTYPNLNTSQSNYTIAQHTNNKVKINEREDSPHVARIVSSIQ